MHWCVEIAAISLPLRPKIGVSGWRSGSNHEATLCATALPT
jgi:hypothetical protein